MTSAAQSTPPFAWGADTGVPEQATGVIVVDLGQIRANWRALSAVVAPAECAAVVKADAYGLGAAAVIPALAAEGCATFFVATADEADEARRLAPGATLYVLDGVLDPDLLLGIGARPVLSNMDDVARWERMIARTGDAAYAALQVDTGLNRLGVSAHDVEAIAGAGDVVDRLGLTLLMSHLSCADEPGHAMNAAQLSRFEAARARLADVPASLAASDGLMLGSAYHFDLVRPGYALYGGQALARERTPVSPAVTAYARLLQIRDVAAGETVGYAATYHSATPRRIATIAAGYADGIFRHASAASGESGGAVAIGGIVCPIVGRVSMDLVTVDVTDADMAVASPADAGGWAELIGPTLSIEDVGRRAGTIGYEVLTRLGRRFHRIYLQGGG